ncbi:TetR/AcrR family transcriptional regulator [Nocardiopsis rhodophaea]|uniref:TetR/AcrR family transcriptional regulator n=1 Tax=Nocardiopsis rhodophaea TaxID=280238 RepID=A0ABP5F2E6_9ACTN
MPRANQPRGSALLRESVTATIRCAVFEELAETGCARMSMDAVARRAGVGKAALYRRWASKDQMLIDLVSTAARDELPAPADTGSLRGDVASLVAESVGILDRPQIRRILLDLLAEAGHNPALSEAVRSAIAAPLRATLDAILDRAVTRGELPPDLDRALATDLLGAPLFFRLLAADTPVDAGYRTRLTRSLLAALTVAH